MRSLGLQRNLADAGVYDRTVARFRDERILLPTFAQLADPTKVPDQVVASLGSVGPDDAHPLNLFRVHWYNGPDRRAQLRGMRSRGGVGVHAFGLDLETAGQEADGPRRDALR